MYRWVVFTCFLRHLFFIRWFFKVHAYMYVIKVYFQSSPCTRSPTYNKCIVISIQPEDNLMLESRMTERYDEARPNHPPHHRAPSSSPNPLPPQTLQQTILARTLYNTNH